MIYGTLITIPAGGSKATATRTTLKINKGVIWLMEVYFPAGCVGLAHVQLFDGGYQMLPASPDKTLSGDGVLLRYDDLYLKEKSPYEIAIVTWNEDELWSHTIQIRIGMASSRLFMARYIPSIGWEDYTKEIQKTRENQDALQQAQITEVLKKMGEG